MSSRYLSAFLLGAVLMLGGCKKYLDVQPETSYTENQVYGSESALIQAFNGLYLDMAARPLYGSFLSSTVIELMAQRFKPVVNGSQNLSWFVSYNYNAEHAAQVLDTIWRKAYSTILATNVFLSKIDNSVAAKVISADNGNLLKGEALAIRGMLHFDLLRFYGPVYATAGGDPAIPYYTQADGKMQPILSGTAVMEKVLTDLTTARQLLAKDPVITKGISFERDFYSSARNQRMNYFAVRTLLARAYLWAGKKAEANAEAKVVLDEGEKWFPWVEADAVNNAANPDRVFSTEILFGVNAPQLYNNYDFFFNPALTDQSIYVPYEARFTEVFEGMFQDYRVVQTWLTGSGKNYRTFYKFAPLATANNWQFLQPLLRKSELYLILAETETDPARALDFLNTERRRRGLAALPGTASLPVEIRKEYQKEFWGEGQLFFYYKRINANNVPMADLPYPWATVEPVYKVPLPVSETSTR